MKRLVFLLSLTVAASALAQNAELPKPNEEEFRLKCKKENGGLGAKIISLNFIQHVGYGISSVHDISFSDLQGMGVNQSVTYNADLQKIVVMLSSYASLATRNISLVEDQRLGKMVLLVAHSGDDGSYTGYYTCVKKFVRPI